LLVYCFDRNRVSALEENRPVKPRNRNGNRKDPKTDPCGEVFPPQRPETVHLAHGPEFASIVFADRNPIRPSKEKNEKINEPKKKCADALWHATRQVADFSCLPYGKKSTIDRSACDFPKAKERRGQKKTKEIHKRHPGRGVDNALEEFSMYQPSTPR
jgi:hypothetical protein